MTESAGTIFEEIRRAEEKLRLGGGSNAIARQHEKGRLTARERIDKLIDPGTEFFELGLWAAWNMYRDWGGAPAAGESRPGPRCQRSGTTTRTRTRAVPVPAHPKGNLFFQTRLPGAHRVSEDRRSCQGSRLASTIPVRSRNPR